MKRIVNLRTYTNFRQMLKTEGVTACLPHLDESAVDEAVAVYHSFRPNQQSCVKRYGVVAIQLGDVYADPLKHTLTRQEVKSLDRVLREAQKDTEWLTRISSGYFAQVFKFKRHNGTFKF